MEEIIYEEVSEQTSDSEGVVQGRFKEVARHLLCPAEGHYGIQIPVAMRSSFVVKYLKLKYASHNSDVNVAILLPWPTIHPKIPVRNRRFSDSQPFCISILGSFFREYEINPSVSRFSRYISTPVIARFS